MAQDFKKPYSKFPSQAKIGDTYRWHGYDSMSLDRTKFVEGTVVDIHDGRDWRVIKIRTPDNKEVRLFQ